jgi:hypothetical protein
MVAVAVVLLAMPSGCPAVPWTAVVRSALPAPAMNWLPSQAPVS